MIQAKNAKLLIPLVLALVVAVGQSFLRKKPHNAPTENHSGEKASQSDIFYHGRKVEITKHGKCRMGCRHIDEYEVQEIVDKGQINPNKSKDAEGEGKCPTVAIEGYTRDQQHVRIVVADCGSGTPRLVTVIDLENDYQCDCY